MPRPMPPIEPIYASSRPQRFERCQSEDVRPQSVWGRFQSYDDTEVVRRVNSERAATTFAGHATADRSSSYQSGSLPRPRATVKPLPTTVNNSIKNCDTAPLEPLSEMRKPNFGRLVENDEIDDDEGGGGIIGEELLLTAGERPNSGGGYGDHEDTAMPFANERAGTIKYKTNPQVAFEQYSQEEENERRPTEQQPKNKRDSLEEEKLSAKSSSLLKTPSRAPNRSAADVLLDIGTMLTDLTEELDSMLKLDKS